MLDGKRGGQVHPRALQQDIWIPLGTEHCGLSIDSDTVRKVKTMSTIFSVWAPTKIAVFGLGPLCHKLGIPDHLDYATAPSSPSGMDVDQHEADFDKSTTPFATDQDARVTDDDSLPHAAGQGAGNTTGNTGVVHI